jgi:transposase
MRKIEQIWIGAADRERLERLVRDRNTPQKVVWRAQIVLSASEGMTAEAIAATVAKSLLTVRRWRQRYTAEGVEGLLKDATRPSRVKPLSPELIKRVAHLTLHAKPPNATHWSGRSMAAAAGTSLSSVQRIWAAHGLKPHLIKTFKVSRDKNFSAKVEDVVGLYLHPPHKALVLCVDEKSQIQALDRTQPGLPMKKGRAGTMTHDYKRNGTTTLFAALNMLDGSVIGACMPRHRHREFLRFLQLIDQRTPGGLDLHLIVDNYATHKTPGVQRWLKAHPRSTCTSRPPRHPGSTWSNASSPKSPENASGVASSKALPNYGPLSWNIWKTTMLIPNPSSGPSQPAKSSKKSPKRNKRWSHNTREWFMGPPSSCSARRPFRTWQVSYLACARVSSPGSRRGRRPGPCVLR